MDKENKEIAGTKRNCVLCPKLLLQHKSYKSHLKEVHDIVIDVKVKLKPNDFDEKDLEHKKEYNDKIAKECEDLEVVKIALRKVSWYDYMRGQALRHYVYKQPQSIKSLNDQVISLKTENEHLHKQIVCLKNEYK